MDRIGEPQVYYSEANAIAHSSFRAMNTLFDILICGIEKPKAESIFERVYSETIRIEKLLNRFDPESEVSVLNNRAGSQPVNTSLELYAIIQECKQLNLLSNGYFDICINSLEHQNPGMECLKFNDQLKQISFANANVKLDFGAYAKGYALDKIKEILKGESITDALINFGNSSILAIGKHPKGNFWKVDLQNIYDPKSSVYSFELTNNFLTTSGKLPSKIAHVISPIKGEICDENNTISVVTNSAIIGEAISTALFAARTEEIQKQILQNLKVDKAYKIVYENSLAKLFVINK